MTVTSAMILAAGRGERLRPLTDGTPKPLVQVAGRTLIEHHLDRLAAIGVRRVVINLHHLGERIRDRLAGRGTTDLEVRFTEEAELLETAGGIRAALPLLGDAPFMVVNGDVFCDFDLARLLPGPGAALAHMVMVPCPPWAAHGDFDLAETAPGSAGRALLRIGRHARLTYSGIGVYAPAMFADLPLAPMPLRPLMDAAIAEERITGELHDGIWEDIGTLERLAAARARYGA